MTNLRNISTTTLRTFLVIITVLLPLVGSILGQQQEEGFCKVNYNATQQCQLLQHIEGTNLRDYFTEWKENMKEKDLSQYNIPDIGGRKLNSSACLINKCLSSDKFYSEEESGSDDKSRTIYKFYPGNICYEKYEMLSMSVRSSTNATSGIVDFLSKDNILTSAPLVDGCFNGLSKSLWCYEGQCGGNQEEKSEPDFLDSLVVYTEEKIHEDVYVWSFSPLGALYCTLNIVGRAEGEDCVYLYSDIKSGIVGTWRDGLMVHGKPAILKNFTINSDYGLLQPEMEILDGREKYTFYESTNNTVTPDKMLSDIYEEMNLFVAPSPMKDAGEGLFTKTQLKKGDLVAAYNGVKITFEEASESKELRTSRYIVGSWDSHLIDVPKVYRSTTNYVASLGHKANSANIGEPHNAVYGDCDHPRFGEITCVMATRDIQPYEEVLAFYGETYWSQPQECNL